jgi:hypothetical protein
VTSRYDWLGCAKQATGAAASTKDANAKRIMLKIAELSLMLAAYMAEIEAKPQPPSLETRTRSAHVAEDAAPNKNED